MRLKFQQETAQHVRKRRLVEAVRRYDGRGGGPSVGAGSRGDGSISTDPRALRAPRDIGAAEVEGVAIQLQRVHTRQPRQDPGGEHMEVDECSEPSSRKI